MGKSFRHKRDEHDDFYEEDCRVQKFKKRREKKIEKVHEHEEALNPESDNE